jgi:hypothetical protein
MAGHKSITATVDICGNSRDLHRLGEKLQVIRPAQARRCLRARSALMIIQRQR